MEREEIPCAHVFRVLKHYGLRGIPPCCVAVRWTMQAKNAFKPDRTGCTHVWSEQMDRFRELRNMSTAAMFKVSMSSEKSERVKALLKGIMDEDAEDEENAEEGENDHQTNAQAFGPLPAYFSGANQSFTGKILDPIPIKGKGALCKKRPKSFHEKFGSRDKGF